MNDEIWVNLFDWEGVYEISNLGRIKRIKKNRCKLGILSPAMVAGYLNAHLRDTNRNEQHLVHRLVLYSFIGNPPIGKEIVNHKNGIRHDNRLENLEWCNYSENNYHAYNTLNRAPVCNKGEKAGRAKLTDNDVLSIREEYATQKVSQQSIANKYNVAQNLISKIILRQIWSHI